MLHKKCMLKNTLVEIKKLFASANLPALITGRTWMSPLFNRNLLDNKELTRGQSLKIFHATPIAIGMLEKNSITIVRKEPGYLIEV